jgi:hypothetical protein
LRRSPKLNSSGEHLDHTFVNPYQSPAETEESLAADDVRHPAAGLFVVALVVAIVAIAGGVVQVSPYLLPACVTALIGYTLFASCGPRLRAWLR